MISVFDTKKLSDALSRQRAKLTHNESELFFNSSIQSDSGQSVDSGYIWLPFEVVSFSEKDPLVDFPLTVGQFLSILKKRLLTKDQVTLDNMYIEGNQDADFMWALDDNDDSYYPLYIPWKVVDVSRYPGIYSVLGIADSTDVFLYWEIEKNIAVRWAAWPREAPERVKFSYGII